MTLEEIEASPDYRVLRRIKMGSVKLLGLNEEHAEMLVSLIVGAINHHSTARADWIDER